MPTNIRGITRQMSYWREKGSVMIRENLWAKIVLDPVLSVFSLKAHKTYG